MKVILKAAINPLNQAGVILLADTWRSTRASSEERIQRTRTTDSALEQLRCHIWRRSNLCSVGGFVPKASLRTDPSSLIEQVQWHPCLHLISLEQISQITLIEALQQRASLLSSKRRCKGLRNSTRRQSRNLREQSKACVVCVLRHRTDGVVCCLRPIPQCLLVS